MADWISRVATMGVTVVVLALAAACTFAILFR